MLLRARIKGEQSCSSAGPRESGGRQPTSQIDLDEPLVTYFGPFHLLLPAIFGSESINQRALFPRRSSWLLYKWGQLNLPATAVFQLFAAPGDRRCVQLSGRAGPAGERERERRRMGEKKKIYIYIYIYIYYIIYIYY